MVVTTPLHNSTQDECVTFEFYDYRHIRDTTAGLSVYALYENSDEKLLWTTKQARCNKPINSICSGWTNIEFRLPVGEYSVKFEATVGMKDLSDMAINNVIVNNIRDCQSLAQLPTGNSKLL